VIDPNRRRLVAVFSDAKGSKILMSIKAASSAYMRDPGGNLLEFMIYA
jgi:hypothetical protein